MSALTAPRPGDAAVDAGEPYLVVEDLPRNAMGKVVKPEVRDLFTSA